MWRGGTKIVFLALVVTIATVVEGQKKYTDGNRPYEFGFKIDGEQHRQEKKDESGLIMGEFGFITGDGIYHVTVFATDENGNYKILSMKHIRVGPSPWGPAKQKTPATTTTTTTPAPPPPQKVTSNKLQGKPGCSGCLIPTPPPPPGAKPNPPSGQFPGTPGFPSSGGGGSSGKPGQFPGSSGFPGSGAGGGSGGSSGSPGNYPGSPGSPGTGSGGSSGSPGQFPGSGSAGKLPGSAGQFPGSGSGGQFPGSPGFPGAGQPGSSQGGPNSPSGQRPGSGGSTSGLPAGVTVDDVMGLLYKFNYTVGFHGHNEQGYRNGDKDGEYYANYRDGLSRIVTYVANENGFQPKVKFVRLNSEDTPKAETEKEYGLKGYEFKWFNRR